MPNDPGLADGAGLPAWFGEWIADLSDTIEVAAGANGPDQRAKRNAGAYLATLRANTDPATLHLDMMLAAVLSAVGDLEELAEDVVAGVLDPTHAASVKAAHAKAIDTLAALAELLRTAKPSDKARSFYG